LWGECKSFILLFVFCYGTKIYSQFSIVQEKIIKYF
jgi:hypothetical protein